ncbi:MAG: helix-turn-helix domain-containing protein [bacterium]
MANPRTILEPPLSSRDVAVLLDLSPDDVNELARRGEIPAFKQGRFWRFRRLEVLRHRQSRDAASALAAPVEAAPLEPLELKLSA